MSSGRIAATALAIALAVPAGGLAQEASGAVSLAEQLRAHTVHAVSEERGRLVIRPRVDLPADATRPRALVSDLLAPTVAALAEDGSFDAVHVALFSGEGEGAAAVARRLGYDVVVDLELRLVGPELRIEARGYATDRPAAPSGFELARRLDPSLRRYVGFPPRVTEETVVARTARMPSRGYLALAAHDLDGDGRTEIVAVHPDGAQVFRLGAGRVGLRLDEIGRAPWPDAARSPSPPPRPLATAVAVEQAVVARLADVVAPFRVRLIGTRVVVDRADAPCPEDRFPVIGGCAARVEGRDFFDQVLTRGDAPEHTAAGHFYAFAERAFATREDEPARFEALVTPGGRLALRVRHVPRGGDPEAVGEGERSVGAVGYGTALAMADVDVDGSAELLTSHAAPAGAGDQLSMLRALPRGALHVVWRSEAVEGSVWVAAAGDVDGDGLEELLAIEEPASDEGTARLWIVR